MLVFGTRTQLPVFVLLRYDIKFQEHTGLCNKLNKVYKEYCKWYLHPEANPREYAWNCKFVY
jgi:hypothetical protein